MAKADHIHVCFGSFVHHGIDCGDGTAIYYDGEKVIQTSIPVFCNSNHYLVKRYGRFDADDVVINRAKSCIGEAKYDLIFSNCEHFATWCKTGSHRSEQVKNASALAISASASSAAVAAGIGVVGATGAAAGLSGAGIMSGLATVGGIVGGGAVAGVGVLGSAPGLITKLAMDQVLKDDETLPSDERESRSVGRAMTTVGAVAGTAGAVGTIAASGSVAGLSAAGITSGLAAVGSVVGGGMAAGVAITVAAPAVAAAAVGYGAYTIWKRLSG